MTTLRLLILHLFCFHIIGSNDVRKTEVFLFEDSSLLIPSAPSLTGYSLLISNYNKSSYLKVTTSIAPANGEIYYKSGEGNLFYDHLDFEIQKDLSSSRSINYMVGSFIDVTSALETMIFQPRPHWNSVLDGNYQNAQQKIIISITKSETQVLTVQLLPNVELSSLEVSIGFDCSIIDFGMIYSQYFTLNLGNNSNLETAIDYLFHKCYGHNNIFSGKFSISESYKESISTIKWKIISLSPEIRLPYFLIRTSCDECAWISQFNQNVKNFYFQLSFMNLITSKIIIGAAADIVEKEIQSLSCFGHIIVTYDKQSDDSFDYYVYWITFYQNSGWKPDIIQKCYAANPAFGKVSKMEVILAQNISPSAFAEVNVISIGEVTSIDLLVEINEYPFSNTSLLFKYEINVIPKNVLPELVISNPFINGKEDEIVHISGISIQSLHDSDISNFIYSVSILSYFFKINFSSDIVPNIKETEYLDSWEYLIVGSIDSVNQVLLNLTLVPFPHFYGDTVIEFFVSEPGIDVMENYKFSTLRIRMANVYDPPELVFKTMTLIVSSNAISALPVIGVVSEDNPLISLKIVVGVESDGFLLLWKNEGNAVNDLALKVKEVSYYGPCNDVSSWIQTLRFVGSQDTVITLTMTDSSSQIVTPLIKNLDVIVLHSDAYISLVRSKSSIPHILEDSVWDDLYSYIAISKESSFPDKLSHSMYISSDTGSFRSMNSSHDCILLSSISSTLELRSSMINILFECLMMVSFVPVPDYYGSVLISIVVTNDVAFGGIDIILMVDPVHDDAKLTLMMDHRYSVERVSKPFSLKLFNIIDMDQNNDIYTIWLNTKEGHLGDTAKFLAISGDTYSLLSFLSATQYYPPSNFSGCSYIRISLLYNQSIVSSKQISFEIDTVPNIFQSLNCKGMELHSGYPNFSLSSACQFDSSSLSNVIVMNLNVTSMIGKLMFTESSHRYSYLQVTQHVNYLSIACATNSLNDVLRSIEYSSATSYNLKDVVSVNATISMATSTYNVHSGFEVSLILEADNPVLINDYVVDMHLLEIKSLDFLDVEYLVMSNLLESIDIFEVSLYAADGKCFLSQDAQSTPMSENVQVLDDGSNSGIVRLLSSSLLPITSALNYGFFVYEPNLSITSLACEPLNDRLIIRIGDISKHIVSFNISIINIDFFMFPVLEPEKIVEIDKGILKTNSIFNLPHSKTVKRNCDLLYNISMWSDYGAFDVSNFSDISLSDNSPEATFIPNPEAFYFVPMNVQLWNTKYQRSKTYDIIAFIIPSQDESFVSFERTRNTSLQLGSLVSIQSLISAFVNPSLDMRSRNIFEVEISVSNGELYILNGFTKSRSYIASKTPMKYGFSDIALVGSNAVDLVDMLNGIHVAAAETISSNVQLNITAYVGKYMVCNETFIFHEHANELNYLQRDDLLIFDAESVIVFPSIDSQIKGQRFLKDISCDICENTSFILSISLMNGDDEVENLLSFVEVTDSSLVLQRDQNEISISGNKSFVLSTFHQLEFAFKTLKSLVLALHAHLPYLDTSSTIKISHSIDVIFKPVKSECNDFLFVKELKDMSSNVYTFNAFISDDANERDFDVKLFHFTILCSACVVKLKTPSQQNSWSRQLSIVGKDLMSINRYVSLVLVKPIHSKFQNSSVVFRANKTSILNHFQDSCSALQSFDLSEIQNSACQHRLKLPVDLITLPSNQSSVILFNSYEENIFECECNCSELFDLKVSSSNGAIRSLESPLSINESVPSSLVSISSKSIAELNGILGKLLYYAIPQSSTFLDIVKIQVLFQGHKIASSFVDILLLGTEKVKSTNLASETYVFDFSNKSIAVAWNGKPVSNHSIDVIAEECLWVGFLSKNLRFQSPFPSCLSEDSTMCGLTIESSGNSKNAFFAVKVFANRGYVATSDVDVKFDFKFDGSNTVSLFGAIDNINRILRNTFYMAPCDGYNEEDYITIEVKALNRQNVITFRSSVIFDVFIRKHSSNVYLNLISPEEIYGNFTKMTGETIDYIPILSTNESASLSLEHTADISFGDDNCSCWIENFRLFVNVNIGSVDIKGNPAASCMDNILLHSSDATILCQNVSFEGSIKVVQDGLNALVYYPLVKWYGIDFISLNSNLFTLERFLIILVREIDELPLPFFPIKSILTINENSVGVLGSSRLQSYEILEQSFAAKENISADSLSLIDNNKFDIPLYNLYKTIVIESNTLSFTQVSSTSYICNKEYSVRLQVSHGTLAMPFVDLITFVEGSGFFEDNFTIKGTIEVLNMALQTLVYKPDRNWNSHLGIEESIITLDELSLSVYYEDAALSSSSSWNILVEQTLNPPILIFGKQSYLKSQSLVDFDFDSIDFVENKIECFLGVPCYVDEIYVNSFYWDVEVELVLQITAMRGVLSIDLDHYTNKGFPLDLSNANTMDQFSHQVTLLLSPGTPYVISGLSYFYLPVANDLQSNITDTLRVVAMIQNKSTSLIVPIKLLNAVPEMRIHLPCDYAFTMQSSALLINGSSIHSSHESGDNEYELTISSTTGEISLECSSDSSLFGSKVSIIGSLFLLNECIKQIIFIPAIFYSKYDTLSEVIIRVKYLVTLQEVEQSLLVLIASSYVAPSIHAPGDLYESNNNSLRGIKRLHFTNPIEVPSNSKYILDQILFTHESVRPISNVGLKLTSSFGEFEVENSLGFLYSADQFSLHDSTGSLSFVSKSVSTINEIMQSTSYTCYENYFGHDSIEIEVCVSFLRSPLISSKLLNKTACNVNRNDMLLEEVKLCDYLTIYLQITPVDYKLDILYPFDGMYLDENIPYLFKMSDILVQLKLPTNVNFSTDPRVGLSLSAQFGVFSFLVYPQSLAVSVVDSVDFNFSRNYELDGLLSDMNLALSNLIYTPIAFNSLEEYIVDVVEISVQVIEATNLIILPEVASFPIIVLSKQQFIPYFNISTAIFESIPCTIAESLLISTSTSRYKNIDFKCPIAVDVIIFEVFDVTTMLPSIHIEDSPEVNQLFNIRKSYRVQVASRFGEIDVAVDAVSFGIEVLRESKSLVLMGNVAALNEVLRHLSYSTDGYYGPDILIFTLLEISGEVLRTNYLPIFVRNIPTPLRIFSNELMYEVTEDAAKVLHPIYIDLPINKRSCLDLLTSTLNSCFLNFVDPTNSVIQRINKRFSNLNYSSNEPSIELVNVSLTINLSYGALHFSDMQGLTIDALVNSSSNQLKRGINAVMYDWFSGNFQVIGSIDHVNRALGAVEYLPFANWNSFPFRMDEQSKIMEIIQIIAISSYAENIAPLKLQLSIQPVNDAPVIFIPGAIYDSYGRVTEDFLSLTIVDSRWINGTADQPIRLQGIYFRDIDCSLDALFKVSLRSNLGIIHFDDFLSENGEEPLSIYFEEGDGLGNANITFLAPLDVANNILSHIVFEPSSNYFGYDANVMITVDDLGQHGSGGPKIDQQVLRFVIHPTRNLPEILIPGDEDDSFIFPVDEGSFIAIKGSFKSLEIPDHANLCSTGFELWRFSLHIPIANVGQLDWFNANMIDISKGLYSSNPKYFTAFKQRLYFQATDKVYGSELWVEDYSLDESLPANGASLFADLYPGQQGSAPSHLVANLDFLYFAADGIDTSWMRFVEDREQSSCSFRQSNFFPFVFYAYSNSYIYDPSRAYDCPLGFHWSTTEEAISIFKFSRTNETRQDLNHSHDSCSSNSLYSGSKPYKFMFSDSFLTKAYKNLNLEESSSPEIDYLMFDSADFGQFAGIVCIQGQQQSRGIELWRTDGTSAGTRLVEDLYSGPGSSNPSDLISIANTLIFVADNSQAGRQMFRLEGSDTTSTTVHLPYCVDDGEEIADPRDLIPVLNNFVFFSVFGAKHGREVCRYNVVSGSSMLYDINSGVEGSNPSGFSPSGDNSFPVLFHASNDKFGRELYVISDESASSASFVLDICKGQGSSNPDFITWYKGRFYFQADDCKSGPELWSSDGTAQGTYLVIDIFHGSKGSSPSFLTVVKSSSNSESFLYFFALDQSSNAHGDPDKMKLWFFDGVNVARAFDATESDFTLDFASMRSSFPSRLAVFNNCVYLSAKLWMDTCLREDSKSIQYDVVSQAAVIQDVDSLVDEVFVVNLQVNMGQLVIDNSSFPNLHQSIRKRNASLLIVDSDPISAAFLFEAAFKLEFVATILSDESQIIQILERDSNRYDYIFISSSLSYYSNGAAFDGIGLIRSLRSAVSSSISESIVFGMFQSNSLFPNVANELIIAGANFVLEQPTIDISVSHFGEFEQSPQLDEISRHQLLLQYELFLRKALEKLNQSPQELTILSSSTKTSCAVSIPFLADKVSGSNLSLIGPLQRVNEALRHLYFYAPNGTRGDVSLTIAASDTVEHCLPASNKYSIAKPCSINVDLDFNSTRTIPLYIIAVNQYPSILVIQDTFTSPTNSTLSIPEVIVQDKDRDVAFNFSVKPPPLSVIVSCQFGRITTMQIDNLALLQGSSLLDRTISMRGDEDDINGALQSMLYSCRTIDGCVTGMRDVLMIEVNDEGFYGKGGPLTANRSLLIEIV